ncbi:pyridoxal phosphate-dependent transferase [Absidia repens]|uniref:serine C-palmitoyltransferase n=1 Tax=Absidia repens TaxID=90262 RepID=A0A1X2IYP4_9FUNG|nr:pyridoxal phosphate-dependent transferase [Absidia repens]
MEPPPLTADHAFINSTVHSMYELVVAIPGTTLAMNYLKRSYQDDPFRIALELFLVFFALRYMLSKKYKPHDNAIKLTEKEIDELVDEWQPESLVPKLSSFDRFNLDKTPLIVGAQSPKTKVAGHAKPLMNVATTNYLNLVSSEPIRQKAIDTLKDYGVGTCGPPGFYGTLDLHMQLERDIARFLGTDEAIIYAQGFSTISSVIPAFSKRGDLLVVDEGVNFAVQKGVQISRSNIRWFKHNDMNDLERVLNDIQMDTLRHKKRLTRRFIVTEALFSNHGDVAPLPKLVELKKKFKYRLILDESQSIGVLGRRGAGASDHFGIDAKEVDMIVGSMSTALCSSGGFCAGSVEIVDHQRLSGSAYCFSASLPAMLTVAASEAINMLTQQPQLLQDLRDRVQVFRHILSHKSLDPLIDIDASGSEVASVPFFHIRIKPALLTSSAAATARNSSHHATTMTREEEERWLQEVVDECASQGVLVARAKYVNDQERVLPRPSIKIHVTAGLGKKENDKAATVVKSALTKVLASGKWKK